ncbi:Histone-lysine N-methyltransferase ASH1L [Folsomia candida]|uniref:Histone-lysine N-methyltransferase ASH1L n=1 Tax=Folsomia candida TaxID=158441 RepID=A0A226DT81_FOLCA|nr:Histone-lysine N-methyltransferase ASH1L [Folsomia candida]
MVGMDCNQDTRKDSISWYHFRVGDAEKRQILASFIWCPLPSKQLLYSKENHNLIQFKPSWGSLTLPDGNLLWLKLAQAVFKIIRGRIDLLNEDHFPVTSVWGRIVLELFSQRFNKQLDRWWDIFNSICKKKGEKIVSTGETTQDDIEVHCICGVPYKDENGEDMLACDTCLLWYHGVCMGVNVKRYQGTKTWTCNKCALDSTAAYVPPLFQPGYRERATAARYSSDDESVGVPPVTDDITPDVSRIGMRTPRCFPSPSSSPGYDGPIVITQKFTVYMANKDWNLVKPKDTGSKTSQKLNFRQYRMKFKDWANAFRKSINNSNATPSLIQGCSISFDDHFVAHWNKDNAETNTSNYYVKAIGHCVRNMCKMKYDCFLYNKPRGLDDAKIMVW